jgi:hypothetical protein
MRISMLRNHSIIMVELSEAGCEHHPEYLCRRAQGLTHTPKRQLNADLLEFL